MEPRRGAADRHPTEPAADAPAANAPAADAPAADAPAGTESAGTESVGTESAGTEPAGTDAVVTAGAGADAPDPDATAGVDDPAEDPDVAGSRLVHADLSDLAPGQELTQALGELPGAAGLDDFTLLEAAAGLERQIASLRADQVEMLAEFARRRGGGPAEDDELYADNDAALRTDPGTRPDTALGTPSSRGLRPPTPGGEFGADEVAARLRWTRWAGEHRLEEAARLAACLPRTWELLAAGRLDYPRVKEIINGTALLCEANAARVDAALAARAPEMTTGQLRAAVAREVAAVDATASRRRAKAAAADRGVRVGPLPDGMAELVATGPAPAVRTMIEALTAAAGPAGEGETRTVGARRFDALRDWAVAALNAVTAGAAADGSGSSGGTAGGRSSRGGRGWRPEVLCTVSLSTLLGLDDAPGELAGYGPLPAHLAREMAADSVLRRVLTDPVTGLVVAVDGHTHPEGLALGRPDPDDPSDEHPTDGDQPDDGPQDGDPQDGDPPDGDPQDGDPQDGDPQDGDPQDGDPAKGEPPHNGPPDEPSDDGPPNAVSPKDSSPDHYSPDGDPPDWPHVGVVSCPVARAGGGQYRPGRAMDRFVRIRDQRCTAPGCRMPAVRCDLDHVVRHPDGPTCPCNLHPLCRHHHRLKHLTRTRVTRLPDGSTHWVLPSGHEYVRPPTPALPAPQVACRRDPTLGDEDPPIWTAPPDRDDARYGIAALAAAIEAAERAAQSDGADGGGIDDDDGVAGHSAEAGRQPEWDRWPYGGEPPF